MIVDLYIENEKINLFADEEIELTSAVSDIEDITKNKTDYTQTFTVPASSINNKKFKHYYNFNIENGFDARTKVNAHISLNGIIWKIGKLKLSKVSIKNEKPVNYTVQFFGHLVSLKDKIKDDKLKHLDLSYYDHDYTFNNVISGLTVSLKNSDIIYNLLAKRQFYYNSNETDTTNTDKLTNIAFLPTVTGDNGIKWNELRPSIRIIRIIEAIEDRYNVKFSREFFSRAEFHNIYMWLNNTDTRQTGGDTQIIDFEQGNGSYMNATTNIGSYPVSNTSSSNDDYTWSLYLYVTPSNGYENIPYTIKYYRNGEVVRTTEVSKGSKTTKDNLSSSISGNVTHEIYYEITSYQEFKYTAKLNQYHYVSKALINVYTNNTNTIFLDSIFRINEEIPDIKVIDFLKGVFKMAKLVVVPTSENDLYVNSLVDYYSKGKVYNLSKYIDRKSHTVERSSLLNSIDYKFKEPTTILAKQFDDTNISAYGDIEVRLYKDETENELIDGDSLEYSLPFENVIFERLSDLNDNELTNVMYGAIVDENVEAKVTKPILYYNKNVNLESKQIKVIDKVQNIVFSLNNVNTATHSNEFEQSTHSLLFNSEYSEWNGAKMENTLYSNYHKPYIDSIFNAKKRSLKYNCNNIPYRILKDLQLNDVIRIDNNYYRLDNFKAKLRKKSLELNLINSFDTTLNSFSASATNFRVDYKAQTVSVYMNNLNNFTYNKIDLGFDTDWVSIYESSSNLFFSIGLNDLTTDRSINIEVIDSDTLQQIDFFIEQTGNRITVDNNTITVDNNEITVDNG